MDHEEASRQQRYLGFVKVPRNRDKFRRELGHFKALNPKYVVSILPSEQNPPSLLRILTAKGAGSTCWVVSENRRIDNQELDLEAALQEAVGSRMGTFLSCVPGKLAFFEDEDIRCILQR
jgi:hypothetical protein